MTIMTLPGFVATRVLADKTKRQQLTRTYGRPPMQLIRGMHEGIALSDLDGLRLMQGIPNYPDDSCVKRCLAACPVRCEAECGYPYI